MLRILAIIFKYDINFFMNFIWVSTMGKGLFFRSQNCFSSEHLPAPTFGTDFNILQLLQITPRNLLKTFLQRTASLLIVVASDSLLELFCSCV